MNRKQGECVRFKIEFKNVIGKTWFEEYCDPNVTSFKDIHDFASGISASKNRCLHYNEKALFYTGNFRMILK